MVIILDPEYEFLLDVFSYSIYKNGNMYYAKRWHYERSCMCMHRDVMMAAGYDLEGKMVDHLNQNGLDNHLCNLRIATNRQNQLNQIDQEVKGLTYHKRDRRWQVSVAGKYVGASKDKQEALRIREEALKKYRGLW